MIGTMTFEVNCKGAGDCLLAPSGLDTPHELCCGVDVSGGAIADVREAKTGQRLICVTPQEDRVVFSYRYGSGGTDYPDAMFAFHDSRYTRAADALIEEAQALAPTLTGLMRIEAIARATAERFTYGHPPERFYDGMDEVPALGCGMTEGSCVDINTYFIATLRAAGFEAGYMTGCFFPAEKKDHCNDMHCWVVTRLDGQFHEWDIAHHLKMGTKTVKPGLNPKPGVRHALAHSMGLDVPSLDIADMKLIAEPVWVTSAGAVIPTDNDIIWKAA